MIRPSTWLRFHFKYSGDCAPQQISCRYGRTLSPCSWKLLGGTVVVKHIPCGMLGDRLSSSAFPSRVSTLSQNNTLGTPRFARIWFRVPTTSSPFSFCPTSMARLSRVNTSRIVNARNRRPSANWSATKSRLHAWLGPVRRRRSRRCCTARCRFRGVCRSVKPSSR